MSLDGISRLLRQQLQARSRNSHSRKRISVQHYCEDALHGFALALVGSAFLEGVSMVYVEMTTLRSSSYQLVLEVLLGRHISSIVLMDQAVGILEEGRHDGQGGWRRCTTATPMSVFRMN